MPHGKICYLEIPAPDPQQSASFYQAVFGWSIRRHGDGSIAFDDGVGEVSGTWRADRPVSSAPPGVLVHESVEQRLANAAVGYKPGNLPQERVVIQDRCESGDTSDFSEF